MIELIIGLVIIGVVLYLLEQLPMDGTIKLLIRVLVILFVVLYLVRLLGFDVPVRLR